MFRTTTFSSKFIFRFSAFSVILLVSVLFSFTYHVPEVNGQGLTSLAVPTVSVIEQDDNNARINWRMSNTAGVTGYKVTWGPASTPTANTLITEYAGVQLQPLTNGQQYIATIQSMDSYGNLSTASQPAKFTGDASRVNSLRSRMTGFFDDFNTAQGAFNELKWNQAVSTCVDANSAMAGSFVNNQFHAHSMNLSGFCDRAQLVDRPRGTFDFTGRTGTITFDMDGSVSRTIWYLDLLDAAAGPLDITSHIGGDDSSTGNPGNMLRVSQQNSNLHVATISAKGQEKVVVEVGLDDLGVDVIPNYRRHWVIQISQKQITITVDGKIAINKAISVPFTKATTQWTSLSYNTTKGNAPYALLHWDNFGFDGPAAATEAHNYRTKGVNGRDFMVSSNKKAVSTEIKIPDSLAGAKAQRLMFTIEPNDYNTYAWKNTDMVTVNGRAFAIQKPTPVSGVVDVIDPYAEIILLPAGVLKTGSNTISFSGTALPVLNIHAEVDFAKVDAPAYTQPVVVYPETAANVMPMMMDVGPSVIISGVGSKSTMPGGDFSTAALTIKGQVKVNFSVNGQLAMFSLGKNPGITKIQVRLNKTVIKEWNFTQAIPASVPDYTFDSTKYANGSYKLDVVAYDASSSVSIPNYFQQTIKAGDYWPVNLKIAN